MQAVILAAGESSRFWPLNQKHKSLIKIMGRPLIWWTIEGLKKVGIRDIIIVQGLKRDIEKESGVKVQYIVQPKPKGTGDAVWQAGKLLKGPFIVADPRKVDVADYLPQLIKKFRANPKKPVLLGVKTDRPEDFGMIRFGGKKVLEIIENPKRGKEPSNIKATETYILPLDFLDYYKRAPEGEANLIDAINLLIKERGAEIVLAKKEPISLKYPWDLFSVLEYLLRNSKAKIYIGKNCQISKNCHLRGPVSIGDNCKIGNSVEIKNSIIGDGTRIPHLSYIGDSIIGNNCNLGAGTITANLRFDKKTVRSKIKGNLIDTNREKFGCVVGNNTQTGINVSLMPGVLIGSNVGVGPASVVFENIEDKTIFYSEFNGVKKST
jgi:UDP-N-acetylglucosamine diphosphorylase / glucose-1-phosphate thymidylyltransferase / UDP-N-acetylgalactosamine diphosphorylase / glucosamine-1-phosphate N-acetyltransferase / galactosamine-1-phosphate N-acetyltransferase